jgi:hypothetical protein
MSILGNFNALVELEDFMMMNDVKLEVLSFFNGDFTEYDAFLSQDGRNLASAHSEFGLLDVLAELSAEVPK